MNSLPPNRIRIGFSGHRQYELLGPGESRSEKRARAQGEAVLEFERAIQSALEVILCALYRAAEHQRIEGARRGLELPFETCLPLRLEFITSLAEGADLAAAEGAKAARGALPRQALSLVTVSPFGFAEFLKDHQPPNSPARAEALWKAADRRLELAPGVQRPGPSRDDRFVQGSANYRETGEWVATQADVLIVVLEDGREHSGEGGTGWVASLARARGTPVVRLRPLRQDGVWTVEIEPPRSRRELADRLSSLVLPGDSSQRRLQVGEVDALERCLGDAIARVWGLAEASQPGQERPGSQDALLPHGGGGHGQCTRLRDYLRERPLNRWLGLPLYFAGRFQKLERFIAEASLSLWPPAHGRFVPGRRWDYRRLDVAYRRGQEQDPVLAAFERADGLSGLYIGLHRSAYAAIYLLGTLAVALAVAGQVSGTPLGGGHGPGGPLPDASHGSLLLTWLELLVLGAILGLFLLSNRGGWRQRGTDYRILAEILRVGRELLPFASRLSIPLPSPHGNDGQLARTWMAGYAQALLRSRPLGEFLETDDGRTVRFDTAALSFPARHAQRAWLLDQASYFRVRQQRHERLESLAHGLLFPLFLLAVFGCLGHLLRDVPGFLLFHRIDNWGLYLTAVGPALAAALHGISTHAEWSRLVPRYAGMAQLHQDRADQLGQLIRHRLDQPSPLARAALLRILLPTSDNAIAEVAEWRWLHAIHDPKLP